MSRVEVNRSYPTEPDPVHTEINNINLHFIHLLIPLFLMLNHTAQYNLNPPRKLGTRGHTVNSRANPPAMRVDPKNDSRSRANSTANINPIPQVTRVDPMDPVLYTPRQIFPILPGHHPRR